MVTTSSSGLLAPRQLVWFKAMKFISTNRGLSLKSLISFMLFVIQFTSVLMRPVTRREPNTHSEERQRDVTGVTWQSVQSYFTADEHHCFNTGVTSIHRWGLGEEVEVYSMTTYMVQHSHTGQKQACQVFITRAEQDCKPHLTESYDGFSLYNSIRGKAP